MEPDSLAASRAVSMWSSSPVGIVEIELGQRIIDCNPAFAAMVGRTRKQVQGQFGWTFFHPDSPPPDHEAVRELLAGSRAAFTADRLLRSEDGSPLAVKLDWSVLRDPAGSPVSLMCFVTDVSVQAAAAAALDAARARAEVLWERAPVGIIEGTPAGVITRVNDAALVMLGHDRDELLGTPAAALADPAFTPSINAGVTKLLKGQTYSAERRYLHADGHAVPVHVSTAVLRDDAGAVSRLVGFVVDMTEAHAQRSSLEAALEAAASAGAELERRQEFTDALLETVDVGIVSCDATGANVVRNRAQRLMLGFPPEAGEADVAPFECRDEHGVLLEPAGYPLARALRGESLHDVDMQQGPVGGPLRDVLVRSRQMHAPDGTVTGAVIAVTDVTAGRQVTRELSEERRQLAEAKRIGRLGSFDYDPTTGRFSASAQLRTLWGLPPHVDVEDLARQATHPDDAPRTAAAFARALTEGGRHTWTFRVHRLTDGDLRHFSATVEVALEDGRPVRVTGTHQDVTELVEAEQRAVRANKLFAAILSATPDYTFILDLATGTVVYGSPGGHRILGLTTGQLLQLGPTEIQALVHPEDQERLQADNVAAGALVDGAVLQCRYRARHVDGSWQWLSRRVTPFRRDPTSGQVKEVLGVVRDVTDVVQAEDQLTHAALHDTLTGLPNRALLMDRLEVTLARAQRSDRDIAVLFCDLDGFKRVNDTAGHAAGDTVLAETARRLQSVLREHDTLARIGGDEFVIVIEPWHRADRSAEEPPTEADDRRVITAVADRILTVLRQPVVVDGIGHVVSASVGITYAGSSRRGATPCTPGEVLQEADAAMYRAKHWGKDRFEVFEHGQRTDLVERGRVEQVLRRALSSVLSSPDGPFPTPRSAGTTATRAALTAAYQPIFDLDSGRLTGFEALARLSDDHGLDVAPDIFIAVAEQTGLIRHLGLLVLRLACAQLATWQTEAGASDLTMAVNVSALQASHSSLGDDVRAALASTGLQPSSLVLELTETVLLQAGPSTLAGLQRLQDEGVGIAIDDFGTGYASLRYLATLPVTTVKIDTSFTAGLPDDPTSSKIVRAVAGLAADMGLVCIVEGVETTAQRDALPPGVRIQGHLTGRPLAPASMDPGVARDSPGPSPGEGHHPAPARSHG